MGGVVLILCSWLHQEYMISIIILIMLLFYYDKKRKIQKAAGWVGLSLFCAVIYMNEIF